MASVNEDLADGLVSYHLRLLRAEAATVRKAIAAFEAGLGAVALEMTARAAAGKLNRTRLRQLAAQLEVVGEATRRTLEEAIIEDLGAVARVTPRTVTELMAAVFPAQLRRLVSGVPVFDVGLMVAGSFDELPWAARMARDLRGAEGALRQILATSLAQGASVPKAVRALRTAGVIEETFRKRLTTVVRTEFQRVANQSAGEVYKANRQLLRGVIHLSTLDSRTCLICGGLHQQRWLYDANGALQPNPTVGEYRPNPQHPNCRCMDAPWVKSWRDLGIPISTSRDRERLDGKAPERMSYEDWFLRRPAAEQQEILGPSRYAEWKAGRPISSFTDQGRILTIQELEAA